MRTLPHRLLGTAVVAGLLATPAVGAPAPIIGTLTPSGCVTDEGNGPVGCDDSVPGLRAPTDVVVSPDGTSVYVSSFISSTVSQFARVPTTGDLTYVGCVGDPDVSSGCATEQEGLVGASALAMSPDGGSVYVVSLLLDDASDVVALDRHPTTGTLTPAGCVADDTSTSDGCTALDALEQPTAVAVSPDGGSVYVTSGVDDAIVTFDRDAMTSALTDAGCIADTESQADCGATAQGLDGAAGVALSPDGTSLYAASYSDGSLVRFKRAEGGDLTAASGTQTGLGGAVAVTVSPDGRSVLVADAEDDALVDFPRATDGSLGARTAHPGYDHVGSVEVSPDGRSLYATTGVLADPADSIVAHLDRDPVSGTLTPVGCFAESATAGCGASTQAGLAGVLGLAVSPDGRSVYAVGHADDALVAFDRTTVLPGPDSVQGRAGARGRQHGNRVKVRVRADEPLGLSLRGSITVVTKAGRTTYPLRARTVQIGVGRREHTLRLGLRAHRTAVRLALRDGSRVIAKVRWVLDDGVSQPLRGRKHVRLAE